MARISKEEAERRREVVNETVFQIFLEEGLDKVTYHKVRDRTGYSVSSIQTYIPKSDQFGRALIGKLSPYFMNFINFDEGIEEFRASWKEAVKDDGIMNIMVLLLNHESEDMNTNIMAKQGSIRVLNKVLNTFGEEGVSIMYREIGQGFWDRAVNREVELPDIGEF